jgi:hypothetical protein
MFSRTNKRSNKFILTISVKDLTVGAVIKLPVHCFPLPDSGPCFSFNFYNKLIIGSSYFYTGQFFF